MITTNPVQASSPAGADSSTLWLPDSKLTLPGRAPRLRLLSFNIQVGLRTGHYGHYLTRAWRHALPGGDMHQTLDRMAELMHDYDFVAVQEADAGSLRTGFVNQLEYLARRAGFAHYGFAVTRNLRPVARHCMGYLSRLPPDSSVEHVLPGRIPGRRAMQIQLGPQAGGLTVLTAHLSLGARDRHRQLEFLSRCVPANQPVVLMGDLNSDEKFLREHAALRRSGLWLPEQTPATYPSWRPQRPLDHVLIGPQVELHRVEALPHSISDHLPLAAEISIRLPASE